MNYEVEAEREQQSTTEFFGGLGPANTISDFITELYEGLFRDILGDETMDRALGSFNRTELFSVMSKIFLQDGNQKLFRAYTES